MNLDQLAIRARLRTPWESTDLGVALARRHWPAMFAAWLVPAAAAFALILWLLPESPGWGFLLVWWLKPAFDRLPLLIASRALFSERMSAGAALKQFFSLNRRDWLAWLTWRRLSPTRSFDLPVTLLEGSTGARRKARISVLHRKFAGAASWLTLVGFHLEMVLWLALAAVVYLLVPEQLQLDWGQIIAGHEQAALWFANGLYLLTMAALAPFYVTCGFCLYISRRIELEGWDIEIQFRKLRQRRQVASPRESRRAAVLPLLLALVITAGLGSGPAPAWAGAPETPAEAREQIGEVLQGEDFHQVREESGWRLKDRETQREQLPEWLVEFFFWLVDLLGGDGDSEEKSRWGPLVAGVTEVLLWAGVVFLCGYLLWRHRQRLQFRLRRPARKDAPQSPGVLFGLDVSRESLPDDVCAEVMALWQRGESRPALSLLYRATLSHLISHYDFAFGDQHTEHECARIVEHEVAPGGVSEQLVTFMWKLTGDWQLLAYAHRAPSEERLREHCRHWREIFSDEA
ncbi:hypothetical protein [Microbulbifer yueqingensis]|uniref:DUF4129 domain-containing protein n=1 Tax=Microbulbifer yueqingensis TaxID=658219 RepID=A0A1G9DDL0_9GAMM|nr:hypothetical protein [Microbulbifer yueqingensis]SDK61986.1 hypothetical protein SAMN05216212_2750 [Microbulbifer yueqingensis]